MSEQEKLKLMQDLADTQYVIAVLAGGLGYCEVQEDYDTIRNELVIQQGELVRLRSELGYEVHTKKENVCTAG